MRAKQLAFTTCLLGAGALIPMACGGDDDADTGSHINPGGGSGGGGGSAADGSGADGNGGNSTGGIPIIAGGAPSTAGSGGADAGCGENAVESTNLPVNILIVMDRSGSMNDPVGSATRWNIVKLGLDAALEATQETIDFGLSMFPYGEGDGGGFCEMPTSSAPVVAISPGAVSRDPIVAALNGTEPNGGTPTTAALALALEYFTTGAGASLEGDKFVLLATDGGPNCDPNLTCGADECTVNIDGNCPVVIAPNCCDPVGQDSCLDNANAIDAVTDLAAAGIGTFVVGMGLPDGSDGGEHPYQTILNALAEAGGHPQTGAATSYYSVSDADGVDALSSTFESIATQLVTSCTQQLTEEPPDRDLLNVDVDGVRLAPLGSCPVEAAADGWCLDESQGSTVPPTIVVTGAPCTQIQSIGAQSVNVLFGCPSSSIPH